jgi:hypothetical protein
LTAGCFPFTELSISLAVRLFFSRNFVLATSSLHRAYEAFKVLSLASTVPGSGHRFGRVLLLTVSFEDAFFFGAGLAAAALGRRVFGVEMFSNSCRGVISSCG